MAKNIKINKSTYRVSQMDCPSEEQMIRMKLQPLHQVKLLQFDIPNRKLEIFHDQSHQEISKNLHQLKLGDEYLSSEEATLPAEADASKERKILWWVLVINFTFFLVEMISGWLASSMGLVADSLDMLADAIVYGLSLLAVGHAMQRKQQVAKISGYFQMSLALIGFVEVMRRFFGVAEMPEFEIMIVISIFALLANVISLYLIQQNKSKEAHMQASAIFTSNDIVVNTGVIVAGTLVFWLESRLPDLIIGSIIFLVVIRGAFRILKIAGKEYAEGWKE